MSTASIVEADRTELFQRLVDAHRGIIGKVAASYSNGTADRADLAQEIALQLWRAWPTYQAERAVRDLDVSHRLERGHQPAAPR